MRIKIKKKKMNQKLGYSEYEEVFYDCLSMMVFNNNYIAENERFFDEVIFKLFEDYTYSPEEVSIRKQVKYFEIFVGTMLNIKPSFNMPEDTLKIS